MAKRPPQRRQHSVKHKGYKFFYSDDEITIKLKYHSNDDIHVHQISFKLRNTKKGKFAFCGIVQGKYDRNGNSWYDAGDESNYSTTNFSHKLILHLVEGKKQNSVIKYIPKKPFKFDSGKEIIGLFWVHENECPGVLDDEFPDIIPKTNDGAIVESI